MIPIMHTKKLVDVHTLLASTDIKSKTVTKIKTYNRQFAKNLHLVIMKMSKIFTVNKNKIN